MPFGAVLDTHGLAKNLPIAKFELAGEVYENYT